MAGWRWKNQNLLIDREFDGGSGAPQAATLLHVKRNINTVK
jgi:hypothetical protein